MISDVANYTVHIASSGNRLEICLPSGAHGSHVANIAAAHYPDTPELNGLAPGAKIISMMISDVRVNSMETGTSLIRAFNKCVEMKVDIVNMSFGEGTHFPDKGIDGALGVSLYAPGAAIAGVPRYTRKSAEMMNGTSMSSPNATGAIGIYIRELLESQNLQEYTVTVQPKFKEFSDNIGKSDLAMKISLQSDGEFLEFPRTFLLTAGEGHFAVKVDPRILSRGEFCYTEIVGLCEDNYNMGPLFRVPITVICPEEVSCENDYTYEREFEALSGEVNRHFIAVPAGANVCGGDLGRKRVSVFTEGALHAALCADSR
ncbi:peptidase, S8/S53 family [Teladorsagia circumcincta]|uniref:Peptidase, S8/S53 family n=1 Tax=Teladorsagia circumcincta TaxID=45464 RepID=A0A2G9V0F4_TELCI|nr:peptidase, S8/S53 family [Teladorsagia circumcincta]